MRRLPLASWPAGADIGLTCQTCGRHIMVARSYLDRRVKEIIPRENDSGGEPREKPDPLDIPLG